MEDVAVIERQTYEAVQELLSMERSDFDPVEMLVVGCSSSEIAGGVIGKMSNPEIGQAVVRGVLRAADEAKVACAFQCCEHLNRALVVERETQKAMRLTRVCVVPKPKAGGSCATAAYLAMRDPVVVESVQADAGLDIGQTMIGMHMRPVAVPVRLSHGKIGAAGVVCARVRPKLIGGARAQYE